MEEMKRPLGKMLLLATLITAPLSAQQQHSLEASSLGHLELAVTYNTLQANATASNQFWLQGGSVQLQGQFWRGLSVTADISGLHSDHSNNSKVGLDMVLTTFGPRYTWSPAHHRVSIFAQGLIGEAHGLHSLFPHVTGATEDAFSMASQVGGGINVPLQHNLSLRAIEANWVHTQLPNSTTDSQNSLRLGVGLVYCFK